MNLADIQKLSEIIKRQRKLREQKLKKAREKRRDLISKASACKKEIRENR